MKKQLIAIGLASLLTLPSVVFAEATWYGSFRAMIHSQDGHTTMQSNGSRWGVKGSNEVSEGLTAVYNYEENLDLGTATIKDGNRLSYIGLSGGFGSLTAGRIWSATYNHVGGVTDHGVWSGNSGHATARISNAVSYAAATGPVSFQLDMQLDPKGEQDKPDGNSIDMMQFGMSLDAGFATVGLAAKSLDTRTEYESRRELNTMSVWNDANENGAVDNGEESFQTGGFRNGFDKNYTSKMGMVDSEIKANMIAASFPVGGFTISAGWHEKKTTTESHKRHTYDVERYVAGDGDDTPETSAGTDTTLTGDNAPKVGDPVYRTSDGTEVAMSTDDASTTTVESDSPMSVAKDTVKDKRTLIGIRGPLGDTGMTFAVNFADHDDGSNPWNFHVAKSLGGGASVAFEHIDADTDADDETETLVQLRVDF